MDLNKICPLLLSFPYWDQSLTNFQDGRKNFLWTLPERVSWWLSENTHGIALPKYGKRIQVQCLPENILSGAKAPKSFKNAQRQPKKLQCVFKVVQMVSEQESHVKAHQYKPLNVQPVSKIITELCWSEQSHQESTQHTKFVPLFSVYQNLQRHQRCFTAHISKSHGKDWRKFQFFYVHFLWKVSFYTNKSHHSHSIEAHWRGEETSAVLFLFKEISKEIGLE